MKKKIFISYSWESESHSQWVESLADRIDEIEELHVIFDKYDLDNFSDKNKFMEQGIFDSELVIIVSTDKYVEKANSRLGGVGIETKMASSRHWEESSNIGSSNILVLKRSGGSVPNFLKEKLHIDFSRDEEFEKSLQELLENIGGGSRRKRPSKRISLEGSVSVKDFTRSEDIIKINHKRRSLLFNKGDCVDYSNGKRIKFELWETSSPRKDYYLILFKNTVIKDTIERFCKIHNSSYLNVSELTILRPTSGDSGYMHRLFKENNFNASLNEVTYSDFIWEYCIDEEAKGKGCVFENPFFIDQVLVSTDDHQSHDLGPASEYIKNEFDNDQKSAALVILASGGMGKTTLCQNLANYFQNKYKSSAVFIQSETIKNSKFADLAENTSIESIYDLYEIYAKVCSSENPENFNYDKTTFELSLLSGNLVVIVDGIDELLSIFPEHFNIDAFIDSTIAINNQLGNSKILLTSREDIFSGDSFSQKNDIKKLNLLGFDAPTCEKYLRKRFKAYTQPDSYSEAVMVHVRELIVSEGSAHVLPFFVDLISGLVEDSVGESINFDLSLAEKRYESNNNLIDCLIYSVFRRELRRQHLEIPIEDVVGIFQEMASVHGDTFSISALEEHILIFYNEVSGSLTRKILLNPLLTTSDGFCKFKYEFLADYFSALYLIELINSGASDDQFTSVLARHAFGDKGVLKEVKKYYQLNPDRFLTSSRITIQSLVKKIDAEAAFKGNDIIYRALSALVHIAVELPSAKGSKESASAVIKEIFNSTDKLEYFSVYGEILPLDFTDTDIWHSRFVKYTKFLSSNFENSKFYYSYFDGVKTLKIAPSFDSGMFNSCRLGDLDVVIEQVNDKKRHTSEVVEKDVSRFLSSFFNRGEFKDKKMRFIRLSEKIGQKFFDVLLREKVIVAIFRKNETFYEINSDYHQSVHNFINNNTVDPKIRKIIDVAC